jgi:sugar-specific transcriptional regulator TrmB
MIEIEKLQSFGLSLKEAQVYKYLLENGSSSASLIGKAVKIGRTNVYEYAKSLENKGLVDIIEKDRRTYFKSLSPLKLKELGEKELENAKAIGVLMRDYLPLLEQDYQKQQNLPQIAYYNGAKGYEEVFDLVYLKGSHKNIYILIKDLEQYEPCDPKYMFSIQKNSLTTHLYVNEASGIEMFQRRDEREFRITKQISIPITEDTIVFEDRIVFGNISKDNFNVIVIKNFEFVAMYKGLLNLL